MLAGVALGQTMREIVQALHLDEGTVRNNVSHNVGKVGVYIRAQAAAYADKYNLEDLA